MCRRLTISQIEQLGGCREHLWRERRGIHGSGRGADEATMRIVWLVTGIGDDGAGMAVHLFIWGNYSNKQAPSCAKNGSSGPLLGELSRSSSPPD